jgi:hypothetical protein
MIIHKQRAKTENKGQSRGEPRSKTSGENPDSNFLQSGDKLKDVVRGSHVDGPSEFLPMRLAEDLLNRHVVLLAPVTRRERGGEKAEGQI